VTGREDATAEEAAQLQALRSRAAQRRQELGESLEALTDRLAAETGLRALARRGARRATTTFGHAAMTGMRRSPVVVAVAASASLLAFAAWWWWQRARPPGSLPSAAAR
jgi:hypothetical protein